MTRWLITGAGGMLGIDLQGALSSQDVIALTHAELDITDQAAIRTSLLRHRPDIVVNAAAWTAVDAAEDHETQAFAVNAVGPAHLARACHDINARVVQVSTDYVFDGQATVPYEETAPLNPRTAYGRTKAAGEWAVQTYLPDRSWIVRTAWLYGAGGRNFVQTMIRLATQRETVDVVDDQRGQPTWSADVARQIVQMVEADAPPGIYHGTAAGETTWYGFARAIFDAIGTDPDRVRPTTSDKFPQAAPRPAYSVLGHGAWLRAQLSTLPKWHESLLTAVASIRAGVPS
jgi:dTDP-4-dehydrorhamnose reductase